jgi:hypothetical protein
MRQAVFDYIKWVIEGIPFEEPILDTCAGWEPNYYQSLFPGNAMSNRTSRILIHPVSTLSVTYAI